MENKENTEKVIIESRDFYRDCLGDGIDRKRSVSKRPGGYVEIYEIDSDGKKKLLGKENLVVYLGREWLISRACNVINSYISPTPDQFIGWFGIGDGGCYSYDPLDPIPPTNDDTDLAHRIPFNDTDSSYGDHVTGEGYYKKKIDTIEFVQDVDNEDKYLIVSTTSIIGITDANGYTISEAALYVASSLADSLSGPFDMYARITFPSLVKSSSRHIVLVWYLFY